MGREESRSLESPLDDEFEAIRQVSISGLFTDASLYNQVLTQRSSQPYLPGTSSAQKSVQDIASLVGNDLDLTEREAVSRFAQVSLDDWVVEDGEAPLSPTDEDSIPSDGETSSVFSYNSSSGSSEPANPSPSIHNTDFDATDRTILVDDESAIILPPERIVDILIQEFGQLGSDGEERLLAEVEGAIIQDVVILGIVHVTTHRLTFHASLPGPDPSIPMKTQVIKAGSVTIHRKGLLRKRRAWLELSNDFISAYPSAREEDHIRPWRTAKLSSIHHIMPEDPEHPRIIRFNIENVDRTRAAILEFDTVESARDWRRDFSVALFFSKRKLRYLVAKPGTEELEGVRINIPLDRIVRHTHRIQAGLVPVASFTVSSPYSSEFTLSPEVGTPATQVIDLTIYKANERWEHISELIAASKLRAVEEETQFPDRPVVVDFGLENHQDSLSDVRDIANNTSQVLKTKEEMVCNNLAIEYTPEVWVTRACVASSLLCVGFLIVSPDWVGFWSKTLALHDVRYRVPTASIQDAHNSRCLIRALPMHAITLKIEGHENLHFNFSTEPMRAEAIRRINDVKGGRPEPVLVQSPLSTPPHSPASASSELVATDELGTTSHSHPGSSRSHSHTALFAPPTRRYTNLRKNLTIDATNILRFPKPVNPPPGVRLRALPRHFVCLTIGSRGDVQPYIALGLRLKREGHSVTIVTHAEYKDWIEGFGLQHREAGGDPGALMQLSVENKMYSPQFIKQSLNNYRGWLDALLRDAWVNCQDADVLLESPYAMAGVHIAEALHIPYFRVCTMPWTKTTEFPHPFIGPPVETPTANGLSYVLFDNILWAATSGQINRWRRDYLKIDPTTMTHGPQSKIPILYNFSPAVVPKPMDWSDGKEICGYWFLDNPDLNWGPSESLLRFMREAREDNKPLVYIGFGSITVPDPQAMTEHIYQAVKKSGVRAIVSRGWSGRMSKKVFQEIEIPDEVYMIDKIPHDWLFPQIDAALHHGGAGTTGASLRAGIPTLIKPWFGDQYFWASRVQKLGAGLRVPSLRVSDLSNALIKATSDRLMREKAAIVGQKIRAEDGCEVAMHVIYTYLPRASGEAMSPE